MRNPSPVLVIALDGADWAIADPMLDRGELPNLEGLLSAPGAARAVLESTVPPVTFPAWTTFLTGVNPGRHGVLDFTRPVPGTYGVTFTGGTSSRRVKSALELLDEAGKKVASVGLPGTWPPVELRNGFVLSGFDAPVAIAPGTGFARPPRLYEEVAAEHGRWVYADVDELRVGPGWHAKAREKLLEGMRRKARIAEALFLRRPWDLFIFHIGETDTAGHHFFAHHDPASPRRPPVVEESDASTLADVYREADRMVGRLVRLAGEEAAVVVASDHGMEGASDRAIYPNRALERAGLLRFTESSSIGRGLGALEGVARRAALELLPARLKELLVRRLPCAASTIESRRRLHGIDLGSTLAFSEELSYAPSVRLNVRGREPAGVVAPEEVDSVVRQVKSMLLALSDPRDGSPLVERVWRREEVLQGPAIEEAPDLYFLPGSSFGYRHTVLSSKGTPGPFVERLVGRDLFGGKGRGPTGLHRREGLLILAGDLPAEATPADLDSEPRGRPRDLGSLCIGTLAPTLMSLVGVPPPSGLDYASLVSSKVDVEHLREGEANERAYSPQEEEIVAARLRSLGYID